MYFIYLTCSTYFLSSLKCPRNAFSTHLLLFKEESMIAKHSSWVSKKIYWNTLLGFLVFQKLIYVCSVSAPIHEVFSGHFTISSLGWDAPDKGCSHLSAPSTNFTIMLPNGSEQAVHLVPQGELKFLCSREHSQQLLLNLSSSPFRAPHWECYWTAFAWVLLLSLLPRHHYLYFCTSGHSTVTSNVLKDDLVLF